MHAVRVNETDTFADEDGANDEYFDFEDISGKLLLQLLITKTVDSSSLSLPKRSSMY